MLLEELHQYYGTFAKIAKKLDFSPNTYQLWRRAGYIPYTTQLLIEKRSKGLFKADISHARPESSEQFLQEKQGVFPVFLKELLREIDHNGIFQVLGNDFI